MLADLAYIVTSFFIASSIGCACAAGVMEVYDLINQRQERKGRPSD